MPKGMEAIPLVKQRGQVFGWVSHMTFGQDHIAITEMATPFLLLKKLSALLMMSAVGFGAHLSLRPPLRLWRGEGVGIEHGPALPKFALCGIISR